MKLYEINAELERMIDPETGEIADIERFQELGIERGEKLEGIALWIKNLESEATAIKAEEERLAERRKSAENKAASLKSFLSTMLNGEKMETPRVKITWRKSKAVQLTIPEDDFIEWSKKKKPWLLTYKEPTISKAAIKQDIEEGHEVHGAILVETNSIQIK